MIELVKRPSQYAKYGCQQTLVPNQKLSHQDCCAFAPCKCPFNECTFVGPIAQFPSHFNDLHCSSVTRFSFNTFFRLDIDINTPSFVVLLEEGKGGHTFILNNYNRPQFGNCITVNSFGNMDLPNYFYRLMLCDGEYAQMKFEDCTRCVRRMQMSLAHGEWCLAVPSEVVGSSGELDLLCRNPAQWIEMENCGYNMKKQRTGCTTTDDDDDEIAIAESDLFDCPVCSLHLSAPLFQSLVSNTFAGNFSMASYYHNYDRFEDS
ncbi:hypothetical protein Sjap_024891 [Stephania japonica]|uniref:SIAH-type domain-containing protein n=1 Tax=Stephania japonica TaxID=461633 RepID=A0AAP0EED4_9MAGN